MADLCASCGKPAAGYATIGGARYCHGDNDPTPTCYERGVNPMRGLSMADVMEHLGLSEADLISPQTPASSAVTAPRGKGSSEAGHG